MYQSYILNWIICDLVLTYFFCETASGRVEFVTRGAWTPNLSEVESHVVSLGLSFLICENRWNNYLLECVMAL